MRKTEQSLSTSQNGVKLFLDDLNYISEILGRNEGKVVLICDEWELDSINELEHWNKGKIKKIEIKREDPSVSISYENGRVFIFALKDTEESIGYIKLIEDYIDDKTVFGTDNKAGYFAPFIVLILSILGINVVQYGKIVLICAIMLMVLSVVLIGWNFALNLNQVNLFTNKYKKNSQSFFARNRDTIVVGIFTAIISSIVTLIINRVVG